MSQENVEVVEQAVEALNARDIEGYLGFCTEDIRLQTPLAPVAGVYEGPRGIRRFWEDLADAAPDFRIEVERIEALSAERVLTFMRVTATGRVSGVPSVTETANVYELAAGKIRRIGVFTDRSEALETVGLRE